MLAKARVRQVEEVVPPPPVETYIAPIVEISIASSVHIVEESLVSEIEEIPIEDEKIVDHFWDEEEVEGDLVKWSQELSIE